MNSTTETTTGLAAESGHWYASDGSPAYEIAAKNGSMRPVTLRDARKLNLFPSVTGILRCAAAPGLERWKVEQGMLACLTLPRLDGEDDSAFMKRALEDSRQQARKAAELGTTLHAQIERSFSGPCDVEWWDYVKPVRAWLDQQFGNTEWCAERSFAHSFGYGGKVDLFSRDHGGIVIDFKSKDFPDPDAVKAYDEHGIQLAAYAVGLGLTLEEVPQRWNVFVSTRVPGLIKAVPWEFTTFQRHWQMFSSLLSYWKADKGYTPGGAE